MMKQQKIEGRLDDLPIILHMWRKHRAGLTLKELSIGTGLSVSFLSDIENGRTPPSLNTLKKIASFYDIKIVLIID